MKKTLFIVIICLPGMSGVVSAQIKPFGDNGEYVSGKSIADIDMDGVADTLVFDSDSRQLFCLLSGRNFDTLSLGTTPEDWFLTHIEARDGGIIGYDSDMRYTLRYAWVFEKETGKFRLTEYSGDYLGDASNDGSGRMTLDLLTGEFTADWYYYDDEADSLIGLPTASVHVDNNPPVYFGDTTDFVFPGYEFYEYYREAYEPPYCDTVRFASYTYDGGEYPVLCGRSPDGGQYYSPVGSGYRELFRGDLVRLTTEIHFYQEPGDDSYRAAMMVGDIQVIEPGKLRLFKESNKKEIVYHDTSQYSESWWDGRRPSGVDYFIAAGNDKRINKYLRKPGRLDIYFYDYEQREDDDPDIAERVCFLTEIYNDHDDKREEVCRIVMAMPYQEYDSDTLYYNYDKKTGKLTLINIE